MSKRKDWRHDPRRFAKPYPVQEFLAGYGKLRSIARIPSVIIGESPEKSLLPQPMGMAGPFRKYLDDIQRTLVAPNILSFQREGLRGVIKNRPILRMLLDRL